MAIPAAIYLDYNATAPPYPEVFEAMRAVQGPPSNPSSVHSFGRRARQHIDEARHHIAQHLHVSPHDLIFTSGGTEANNMVLDNFDHIFASAIEHDSILQACPHARLIAVDTHGQLDLEHLDAMLKTLSDAQKQTTLVSVMAANNETGILSPLDKITKICHAHQVACHSDMVQFLGKSALDLPALGLDFASFSAHKIGGPAGIGALWHRPSHRVHALIKGGGQERGMRSGTENITGIVGFAAALTQIDFALDKRLAGWRDAAEARLLASCLEIEVIGKSMPRLGNTSALYIPRVPAEQIVMRLDLAGFAISAGAACSSGKIKPSHVLTAMGEAAKAGHIIRLSAGWQSRADDFIRVADALIELYKV